MKAAISVPGEILARVEAAAARLGISGGEFFSRAAERWLDDLEGAETTAAIDAALGDEQDTAFAEQAGRNLARHVDW